MGATAPITPVDEKDYLLAERDSDIRHEFVEGILFAMGGASRSHNMISANLVAAVHRHVNANGCRVFSSDMKVRLAEGSRYYYPDVMVCCSPVEDEPDDYVETKPVFVAEVLSSSTESTDRREKRIAYQNLDSVIEYMLISPSSGIVELFRRESDTWTYSEFGIDESIELHSLGTSIRVRDIYSGVPLSKA